MARNYVLNRRAERQDETRKRIAEAALELHSTIGPSRASVSAIAQLAGVQRHTFYRHFPTQRELYEACSGLAVERDPPPSPEPWKKVADPERRLRTALSELYAYYERNEQLLANVLLDAQVNPITAELVERRLERMTAAAAVLAQPFRAHGARRRHLMAALDVVTSFHTWQTLTRQSGLASKAAVDLMVRAVTCVAS